MPRLPKCRRRPNNSRSTSPTGYSTNLGRKWLQTADSRGESQLEIFGMVQKNNSTWKGNHGQKQHKMHEAVSQQKKIGERLLESIHQHAVQ